MSELTLEKETTKLEKHLVKQGRRDFIDEIRAASPDALNAKLLGLAKHNQEIANTKAADQELERAKQRKKDLEEPYKDQKKMNEKLARFVALVMKEQGLQ
jgi:hypothetical protein